jgi:hypothetical protein
MVKHGMFGSPTYRSWAAMKQRCLNPNRPGYKHYGGRGVTICKEWIDSFEAFFRDMGERPEGTSLERVKNERGYEPGNCVWMSKKLQNRNRRNTISASHEPTTGHLSFRLKQVKFKKLQRLAKAQDVSTSQLIRKAIDRLLKETPDADKH